MKSFTTVFLAAQCLALFASATDQSSGPHWSPPEHGDARGPCPMLNSLANHGLLPRNGKNISEAVIVDTLSGVLNMDPELGEYLFQSALTTNPTPSATTFSLSDLNRHNILEHDASLSRADAYFGDAHTFNATIFNETRSHWGKGPHITVCQAAAARLARVRTSNATNPTFALTRTGAEFSLGETAGYILFLGDRASETVPRAWVEYLFEKERLPWELGWKKREEPVTFHELLVMMAKVVNATAELERGDVGQVRDDWSAGEL